MNRHLLANPLRVLGAVALVIGLWSGLPAGNGATALFIDWVAVHRGLGGDTVASGGVGVGHIGYPRVGVGVRGPVRVFRR